MIAARWGMLLVAALSNLAALGAMSAIGQSSLLRVEVTAVVAVLAPLFWPGRGASPRHTALRVLGWSLAASASAAIGIAVLAHPAQPWLRILPACAMLLAILILTHAAAAFLERRWQARSDDADGARELAGRVMAVVLVLLGTSPFWLGPIAEVASTRHPRVIDLVVGVSPITHLAAASGNDLLRDSWLYEHSNLGALHVAYPDAAALAWGYGSACAVLALFALSSRLPRRRADTLK